MDSETSSDELDVAAVWRRVLAYLVDLALVGGGVYAVTDRRDRPLAVRALSFGLLATVVGTLYHVVLEGSGGRTVGKAAVGIAVVEGDGSRCGYRAAVIRTLLRFVDALPFAYLVGFLGILLTERRQRVGDLVANTVVVRFRDG